jgi:hypothetical protein
VAPLEEIQATLDRDDLSIVKRLVGDFTLAHVDRCESRVILYRSPTSTFLLTRVLRRLRTRGRGAELESRNFRQPRSTSRVGPRLQPGLGRSHVSVFVVLSGSVIEDP